MKDRCFSISGCSSRTTMRPKDRPRVELGFDRIKKFFLKTVWNIFFYGVQGGHKSKFLLNPDLFSRRVVLFVTFFSCAL